MNRILQLYVLIGVILLFTGCDTHHPRPAELSAQYQPNIIEKQTSRVDILLEYGAPSMVFENGRILTFRLVKGDTSLENPGVDYQLLKYPKEVKARIWSASQYNLVVVFDENQKVEKWNLIQVR